MVQDYDDDIIELTEVAAEDVSQNDQGVIELAQEISDPEGGFLDDFSMVSPHNEDSVPALEQADIETALEKLIEKKFSQTIEKILFEVMEKVIKQEIKEIKAGLQKDLDDIG